MKVTCIIPTVGRSGLLFEAVNSVIGQKGADIDEVIIVNNGNSSISHTFNDSRVRTYNIVPYAGVSQARNFGAALASNEILTFLDDDDLWPEDYLSQVLSNWTSEHQLCLTRLDKYIDGVVIPYKSISYSALSFNTLFIRNPGVTGSNIFITKKMFYSVGGFDVKLKTSEDKDLLIKILDGNHKALILDDVAVFHRSHNGERLTNYDSVLVGMRDFYRKYRYRFNVSMKYAYLKKLSKIRIKKIIQAL